jgi:hypothetical protein
MSTGHMAMSATRCCAVVLALLMLSGCGNDGSSRQNAVLPSNPADWACAEQHVDVQQWCRVERRGTIYFPLVC